MDTVHESSELRAYRLQRVRAQLVANDVAGILLFDPINIRYATGSRNMAVWSLHNPGRYAFVATVGPVVLFEFPACFHLNKDLETISEQRPALPWYYFLAGPRVEEKARQWAVQIASVLRETAGNNNRLALDRCDPAGAGHLRRLGVEIHEGQGMMEQARTIKSPDEIVLLRNSMRVAEQAMYSIREQLRPGVRENDLWAILHETNARSGGEWIETRLLASGQRTNPWFQESSDRVVEAGDLLGIDTDLIGPFGYLADFSRTFLCPPAGPSREQRRLYQLAYEQVHHNMALLKAGLTFREFSDRCWRVPEEFVEQRYMDLVHGVGLCDEYPHIPCEPDFEDWGYDGQFEEDMVVSVESYVGAVGGAQGVKLEQQVRITNTGTELLSEFEFEEELLQ